MRCSSASGVLNEKPETDVVYTDEDKIDRRGAHSEPFFKPDWSPEFFRGVMYVGHLLVLRRSLVESVGGLDSSFDGVQDYELMLRVSEQTDRIEHVPRVLYHWRKLPRASRARPTPRPGSPAAGGGGQRPSRALRHRGVRTAEPAPPAPRDAPPKPRAAWPA